MGLYHLGGEEQKAFHNFLPSLLADAPFHSALYKPLQNNMEHDQLTCQQALFIFCKEATDIFTEDCVQPTKSIFLFTVQ